MSRSSSGSSRADNAVEPTRSANMIVSWRRSAPVALAPERSGSTDVRWPRTWTSSQRGDRIEENAAMADCRHAEVSEVFGRQLGEACLIDRIFLECLPIAFQAEAAQPGRDIHGVHTHTWPHSSRVITATAPACAGGQAAPQNEKLSLLHPMARTTFFVLRSAGIRGPTPEPAGGPSQKGASIRSCDASRSPIGVIGLKSTSVVRTDIVL